MSDAKFIVLGGFLPTRVRRRDLPLALLFGIGQWMTNAWALYRFRVSFGLPDSGGEFNQHPYSDPERVLAGVISGIIVVLGIAHLQVEEAGIPSGLTLKRALLPVLVVAVFSFGAVPIIIGTSGSVGYAIIVVIVNSATTLIVSLILRRLRQAS